MILKGWNIYPYASVDDVRAAVDTGATLLRYQIMTEPQNADVLPIDGWPQFVENFCLAVDRFLPVLGNAKLIIDLHQPPGGSKGRRIKVVSNTLYRGALFSIWQTISRRYKGVPGVLGYGVLNEPPGLPSDIRALMKDTVDCIRAEDSDKVITVTCSGGQVTNAGSIGSFGVTGLWYEMHMYEPMSFTHQGVGGRGTKRKAPSRQKIENYLKGAIKVQQSGRQVFIGEFSADTFAEEHERLDYLYNCIDVFTRNGFHWCFHCWREGGSKLWDGESGAVGDFMRSVLR